MTGLIKRSFSLAGHRTSVALEPEFWDALAAIAAIRAQTLAALVAGTDAARTEGRPLASALRVMALRIAQGNDPGGNDKRGERQGGNDMEEKRPALTSR